MKYKLITLIFVVASGCANVANAAITDCTAVVCGAGTTTVNAARNCLGTRETCYGKWKVIRCTSCEQGYTLTETPIAVPGCFEVNVTACMPETPECDGTCSSCETTEWRTYNDIYMQRTYAHCNTDTCECTKTTQYACIEGYYGVPRNTTSGCTQCPNGGMSKVGNMLMASNRFITSCYITDGTDASGEFSFDTGGRFTSCGTDCCSYSN